MRTIQWERIKSDHAGSLWRSRTPTGWLVKEVDEVTTYAPDGSAGQGYEWRTSITFVPDANGSWLI